VSGFLVDTNVISEFIKPQPDVRVIDWLGTADTRHLFASVITYGEIRLGIEDLPSGRRRSELRSGCGSVFPHGLKRTFYL
jgi:predicted nucleic acid-binding protein